MFPETDGYVEIAPQPIPVAYVAAITFIYDYIRLDSYMYTASLTSCSALKGSCTELGIYSVYSAGIKGWPKT